MAFVLGLFGVCACSSSTDPGGSGGNGASGHAGGGATSTTGASGSSGASGGSGASGSGGLGGTNSGGSSGSSGAGNAGSSGAGGSSGSASGGSAGAAGSPGAGATGLAVLTVPLAAATDKAHFLITLASSVDMSAATITFHVNVHAGTSGVFQGYVQHGGAPDYNQLFQGWQTLSALSGWQDIVWNVASTSNPNTFDEKTVARLGIEIGGGSVAAFSAATDVVYVDSIKLSGATPVSGPWTFDTNDSISATTFPSSPILWLNTASTDTTATGTTLTWLSGS
jgi:hypothetical protein